jgi:tRNA pseudouridine38-40 synthase
MNQTKKTKNQPQKNYKLTVSYDGSRYSGWEHQPGKDTIQGKLETVLMRMCDMDEIPEVIGAGRTDAGVHAKAMVANVLLSTELSCREIQAYMNRYLPDDIGVVEVREASPRFHARYNAVGKTYSYTCYVGDGKPIFQRKYVTRLDAEPDLDAMIEAASYLQGEHDFKSFCGNPKMKKSTVRLVDSITIKRSKNQIYFTFHGTGFLQHMVRILVGTLLEVGFGRRQPEDMAALLEARDRSLAGPTAPACGLCLEKVEY